MVVTWGIEPSLFLEPSVTCTVKIPSLLTADHHFNLLLFERVTFFSLLFY